MSLKFHLAPSLNNNDKRENDSLKTKNKNKWHKSKYSFFQYVLQKVLGDWILVVF